MALGLGIDAGGTYTDAVLVEFATQQVLAKAKALTTKDELSRGVAAAVGKLPAELLTRVTLVSLSTTLATNAIVEGKGGKVGALLLGFDGYDMARIDHAPKRAIRGRTDITGKVMEPLDEDALRAAAAEMLEREAVDALAVSGMVSVTNPEQEIRAAQILAEMTDKPIVCGHELSMQLDTIKRTITATLNARLLPIIAELIAHVKRVLDDAGISAPLMVVRGDGTLMSEELARRTPVETILSGPAASVCGAQFLAKLDRGLIVDIGGTTSDIAILIDGQPVVVDRGAQVGNWSTQVRAVDIETVGLGGDSAITLERLGKVHIGPRRAVPLAYLAHEHPVVLNELQRLWETREEQSTLIQPVEVFLRVKDTAGSDLTDRERRTLAALVDGPLTRDRLAERIDAMSPSLVPVERLETLGCLQRATLTPTDVMHHLGIFTAWSREAAELGLQLFATRANVAVPRLADFIMDTFAYWTTLHLMHRVIRHHHPVPDFPDGPADRALLDMVADGSNLQGLTLRANYDYPLVAIGAPAAALAGSAARKLGAELIVPEHAEVANAVGAITGTLTLVVDATITPDDEFYVVHSPAERRVFDSLAAAQAWTKTHVAALLEAKIEQAAVSHFDFHRDVRVLTRDGTTNTGSLFLECNIRATAVSRPQFAETLLATEM
jgi:N-methylhydantoinase A/oxoprolinase/acetone carboxylase beta subunit